MWFSKIKGAVRHSLRGKLSRWWWFGGWMSGIGVLSSCYCWLTTEHNLPASLFSKTARSSHWSDCSGHWYEVNPSNRWKNRRICWAGRKNIIMCEHAPKSITNMQLLNIRWSHHLYEPWNTTLQKLLVNRPLLLIPPQGVWTGQSIYHSRCNVIIKQPFCFAGQYKTQWFFMLLTY